MTNTKIIDNKRRIFADFLKEQLANYSDISVATGYWDLPGMEMVLEQIKNYHSVRLLIGREPLIPRHRIREPEPDYPDKDIFEDLEYLGFDEELKTCIKKLRELKDKGVLQVRVYKKSFLHAKCYILGQEKSDHALGIIGSSNFTKNGLTTNTELNAVESDHRVVLFNPQTENQEVGHLYWFNQFWQESEEWNGKLIELLEQSPTGDILYSPYEMYIKTLYELYQDELENEIYQPGHVGPYELFEFQKKNVNLLLRKLEKYAVAMLSDSVGLGKTITAIEVIKNYFSPEERKRVAVICPKALKVQWRRELQNNGIPITPIVLQNLKDIEDHMRLDQQMTVSLFVIDESHNLRKTEGQRYQMLLDWIRKNPKAHVLFLTATPINNELNDLATQFLLGTRGKSDVVKVVNDREMEVSFVDAITELTKQMKIRERNELPPDYEAVQRVMKPLIKAVVVRRTRSGIEKDYGTLKINGVEKTFPKAMPKKQAYSYPQAVVETLYNFKSLLVNLHDLYQKDPNDMVEFCTDLLHPLDQLDRLKSKISLEQVRKESPIYFIYQIILLLGFVPYRWRLYQTRFYGKTVEQIKAMKLESYESRDLQQQRGMYGIFRTILLKRLESSVAAIQISLERYQEKLLHFQKAVKENNKIIGMKDIGKFFLGNDDIELDELLAGHEDITVLDEIDPQNYNKMAMERDMERDLELVVLILDMLKHMEGANAKFNTFKEILCDLVAHPKAGKKVLVFSYFSDTIDHLRSKMSEVSINGVDNANIAFLSSKNRNETDDIVRRFAPIAQENKLEAAEKEINFLFSTDVLSEGQNLQDCGVIINYDLHWNPVRMIQRNGRINRLGSEYPEVFIYNMTPELKLETYLKLVKRLEGKIDMIKHTIGSDQSVLGEKSNPIDYVETLEDLYSNDEKKQMEAMIKAEEAGDFLLAEDDYVLDLKKFHQNSAHTEKYKKSIYNIPRGKWGTYPPSIQEKRPEVLVFTRLEYPSEKEQQTGAAYQFLKIDLTANQRKTIPNLIGLKWIRADVNDNQRKQDTITLDRKKVRIISESLESYRLEAEEESVRGQKKDLLDIFKSLGNTFEEIVTVRKSFRTSNFLYKKDIEKLTRDVVQAHKKQKPYQDNLQKLLKTAELAERDEPEGVPPTRALPLLYFTHI